MSRRLWMMAAAAAVLAAGGSLLAHHAFSAEFDANAPVTLRGPVTKVEWINPHAWIHLEVKTPAGKPEIWMVEGGTPNTLQRVGITRDSIKIGTVIVVAGYQGQGRPPAGQRPRHHVPRRPHAVHGVVGHRRAARRPRSRTNGSRPKGRGADVQTAPHLVPRCGRALRSACCCRPAARPVAPEAYRAPRTPGGAPGPQRHLAGEQHRELGPRNARGASGPGLRARRRVQRAAGPRRRRRRRDPVPARRRSRRRRPTAPAG